ncbi:hypothetical protein LINPERPRIM_LOCUS3306 [Linum perenne]
MRRCLKEEIALSIAWLHGLDSGFLRGTLQPQRSIALNVEWLRKHEPFRCRGKQLQGLNRLLIRTDQ